MSEHVTITYINMIPLILTGRKLGLLDPTQASRLLSAPKSQLAFASYHPRAGSFSDTSNINPELLPSSPNRIVVELDPDGHSIWRPIPLARNAFSLLDEGCWPRLILFRGYAF